MLHIFAYQKGADVDNESSAFSIGRYDLPSLTENRIYLTGHMECSPISLDAQISATGAHHLLVDGEGIIAITLETLYVPVEGEQAPELPPNFAGWTSTTACALIAPFHASAQKRLAESKSSASSAARHSFEELARGTLSWLMRHPVRPNRDSICGYRLYMSSDAEMELGSRGIPRLDRQTLRIYDFTPMHVKKAIRFEGRDKKPLGFSKSLDILSLETNGPAGSSGNSSRSPADYEKVVVTRSAPATESSVYRDGVAHFATESPYILTTKRIRLTPYHVCQVTHNHMLLCQVSAPATPLGERDCQVIINWNFT